MTVYAASGSFTPTISAKYVVICRGAGGGGAAGNGLATNAGGGGGGGGAVARSILDLVAGTSYPFTVGAAGQGSSQNGQLNNSGKSTAGTAGGATSFNNDQVKATGGSGGTDTASGAGATTTGCVGQAFLGGNAGQARSELQGTNTGCRGGNNGDSTALGGAGGVASGSTAASGGQGGGGGGGGNASNGISGNGGVGTVEIYLYTSPSLGRYQYESVAPGAGNWTAPETGTVWVELIGAGGSSGVGPGAALGNGGSGGGGGALARKLVNVIAGQTYSFVIGAGGPSANLPTSQLADGGATTWETNVVKAAGGKKGGNTGAAGGLGGAVADSIGDTIIAGDPGGVGSTTGPGGAGGAAGFPYGGSGGAPGSNGNPTPGSTPGGGGGAPPNTNNQQGGTGGNGRVRISYFVTIGKVGGGKPGFPRYITGFSVIKGGVKKPATVSVIKNGKRKYVTRSVADNGSTVPSPPPWVPAASKSLFNVDNGTFNFNSVNLARTIAAIKAKIWMPAWWGDSLTEGWISVPAAGIPTTDYPNSWPYRLRNKMEARIGRSAGSTGQVRFVGGEGIRDSRWSGDNGTSQGNYIQIAAGEGSITFNSDIQGSKVGVTYLDIGTGAFTVKIGSNAAETVTMTNTGQPKRIDFTPGTTAAHVVLFTPTVGTSRFMTCEVYKPGFFRFHNLAQGGSMITATTGEKNWDESDGSTRMIDTFSKASFYGQNPDTVLLMLADNDYAAYNSSGMTAAKYDEMLAGYKALRASVPNSDFVILNEMMTLPLHSTMDPVPFRERLYAWAVQDNLPIIDVQWLTGGCQRLQSLGQTGDDYGHMKPDGQENVANIMDKIWAPYQTA